MRFTTRLVAAAAFAAGLASGAARAELLTYDVSLSGANEVPPNDSPGTGQARVTLDTSTRVLTWDFSYSGLTGPATGMHFHGPSEKGRNAGIVLPFPTVASPVKGTATLTDSQAADVAAGRWYINIHTTRHPGGELRGQVVR